jgi:type II secretion system protein J
MRARAAHRGFTLIELMVAVFITAIVLSMGYGAVNQALTNHEALDARQERLLAVQTTMRLLTQDFTQLAPRPVRQPLGDGWLPALLAGTSTGTSMGLSAVNTSTSTTSGTSLGSNGSAGSSNNGFGSSSGTGNSGLGSSFGSSSNSSSSSSGLGSSFGSSSNGSSSSSGLGSSFGSSSSSSSSTLGTTTSTTTGAGTFTSSSTAAQIVTLTRAGWANPAGIQRPALERVTYILENGTLRREHWPVLDAVMTTTTVRRELLDKVKSVTVRYMDLSFNWREQWPPQALAGDPNANLRLRPIAVEVTLELEDWGKIVRVIEIAA